MHYLESLVRSLVSIVECEPSVCKSSHIPTFLGTYSATRTRAGAIHLKFTTNIVLFILVTLYLQIEGCCTSSPSTRRMVHLQEPTGNMSGGCWGVGHMINFSLLFAWESPYLWGEAALESYMLRSKEVYWVPVDMSDALRLINSKTLIRSSSSYPLHTKLEVCCRSMPRDEPRISYSYFFLCSSAL